MRTTLDIDDDVLRAAEQRARLEQKTTGQVISELARRALAKGEPQPVGEQSPQLYGFEPFGSSGRLVTNELIATLRSDDAY